MIKQCEKNREKARKRRQEISGSDGIRKKEAPTLHFMGYKHSYDVVYKSEDPKIN